MEEGLQEEGLGIVDLGFQIFDWRIAVDQEIGP